MSAPERLVDPSPEAFARDCAAFASRPVVHATPVLASASLVADALHAVGASPVMSVLTDEVSAIHARCRAVVLSLGTPDERRFELLTVAAHSARDRGLPLVLDPVGVGASPRRLKAAMELSALERLVIRGNAAEIRALAGADEGGAPIDGAPQSRPAPWEWGLPALERLASRHVVVATGPVDGVWSGTRGHLGRRGHVLQSRVTGMGCALSALTGAFRAVNPDPFLAAVHALWLANAAAEIAAVECRGPGTFVPAWLDALALLRDSPAQAWRSNEEGEFHV